MAIDLDALAAELTAAGLRVDPSYGFLWAYYENDEDPNNNFRVFFADDKQATIRAEPRNWGVNLYHPVVITVLDIIRRHVAPPVPPAEGVTIPRELNSDLVRVLDAAEGWASELDFPSERETAIRGSVAAIRALLEGGQGE